MDDTQRGYLSAVRSRNRAIRAVGRTPNRRIMYFVGWASRVSTNLQPNLPRYDQAYLLFRISMALSWFFMKKSDAYLKIMISINSSSMVFRSSAILIDDSIAFILSSSPLCPLVFLEFTSFITVNCLVSSFVASSSNTKNVSKIQKIRG